MCNDNCVNQPEQSQEREREGKREEGTEGEEEGCERRLACLKCMQDPLAGRSTFSLCDTMWLSCPKFKLENLAVELKGKKNHLSSRFLLSCVGGIFIAPLGVLILCAMNQTGEGAKHGFFSLSGFQRHERLPTTQHNHWNSPRDRVSHQGSP